MVRPPEDKSLTQLVYLSNAQFSFTRADLADVLLTARKNNSALGVSGMLVCTEGAFLQVLEGPADTVDALYERIKLDSRHKQVALMVRESIDQRAFGDWSMGAVWATTVELQDLPGCNDFFTEGTCLQDIDAGMAKKLLQGYRRNVALLSA
jgi:hypothetical protein